jgi:uncharacterized repeat protein (TIGR04138 family)
MYNLLQSDPRYKFEAYQFVREALAYAHEHLQASEPSTRARQPSTSPPDEPPAAPLITGQHITGQQLCEACRLYGLQQYGYLTGLVLSSWGVRSTSDFGEIVYNLIRIEQMRKSDADRREDFNDVYSFETAFEPRFDAMPSESAG